VAHATTSARRVRTGGRGLLKEGRPKEKGGTSVINVLAHYEKTSSAKDVTSQKRKRGHEVIRDWLKVNWPLIEKSRGEGGEDDLLLLEHTYQRKYKGVR